MPESLGAYHDKKRKSSSEGSHHSKSQVESQTIPCRQKGYPLKQPYHYQAQPYINQCQRNLLKMKITVFAFLQKTKYTPIFCIIRLQKAHKNWNPTASNKHLQCQGAAQNKTLRFHANYQVTNKRNSMENFTWTGTVAAENKLLPYELPEDDQEQQSSLQQGSVNIFQQ